MPHKYKILKIYLGLLLMPLILFAQEKKDILHFSKFSIGGAFAPEYSSRTLDLSNKQYSPKLGFSSGFYVSYNLSLRFAIRIGIYYSKKEYKWDTSLGDSTLWVAQHNYLIIPVTLKFNIINKRIKVYSLAGFVRNSFLLYKRFRVTEYYDGAITKELDFKSSTSFTSTFVVPAKSGSNSIYFAIGLNYRIIDELFLVFEPYGNFFTSPISDYLSNKYLYSIGITMGVFYKL